MILNRKKLFWLTIKVIPKIINIFVTRKNTSSSMGNIPPINKPVEVFNEIVQILAEIAKASIIDRYVVDINMNRTNGSFLSHRISAPYIN